MQNEKTSRWKRFTPWQKVAIIIAIILGVCGLAFVGFILLAIWAFSSYGSNK